MRMMLGKTRRHGGGKRHGSEMEVRPSNKFVRFVLGFVCDKVLFIVFCCLFWEGTKTTGWLGHGIFDWLTSAFCFCLLFVYFCSINNSPGISEGAASLEQYASSLKQSSCLGNCLRFGLC